MCRLSSQHDDGVIIACRCACQNDDGSASRHADVLVENTRWHHDHVSVELTRLYHVDVSSIDLTRRWPLMA